MRLPSVLVLSALGLAGCVAQPPPAQVPLVAIPGPTKTEAAFRQDDVACRVALVPLPAADGDRPTLPAAPLDGAAPAYPPGVQYLRCMASRGNTIEPYGPVPVYAVYAPYPVYYGFGYGFPQYYGYVSFGLGGRYHGGYGGRYYGGYGRGDHGWRESRGFYGGGGGGWGGHHGGWRR